MEAFATPLLSRLADVVCPIQIWNGLDPAPVASDVGNILYPVTRISKVHLFQG